MTDTAQPSPDTLHNGHRRMFAYDYARLVDRATSIFCTRAFGEAGGLGGAARDRMMGLAQSARARLAAGAAKASSQKDLEGKSAESSRDFLAQLADDYESYLFIHGEEVWSEADERRQAVADTKMERFQDESDLRHGYAVHLQQMWERFEGFFAEDKTLDELANVTLVLIDKALASMSLPTPPAPPSTDEAQNDDSTFDGGDFRDQRDRFGDRGSRFGDRGSRFGDRDRGGRFGDRGGRFGDRDRGGRFGDRGGRFGDRDRGGRFGDRDRGGRYGDRDRGGSFGSRDRENVDSYDERFGGGRDDWGSANDVPAGPAPSCPKCGKPMRLRTAKNGPHAGESFWGCVDFPDCFGRRDIGPDGEA